MPKNDIIRSSSICYCNCHTDGSKHIRACCKKCGKCGKRIKIGFIEAHKESCNK